MSIRLALLSALLFGMMGAASADCQCNPPSISLTTSVNKGTISGNGTFSLGTTTFQSITLFAANKDGGKIFKAEILKQPTGANWPNMGTLDIAVPYLCTYKVWAVLKVDDRGKDAYYCSAVNEVTVAQGDAAPSPIIIFGCGQPGAAMGTITSSGTFAEPGGSSSPIIQLFVAPASAGGVMIGSGNATLNTDANPKTWTATSINGLTMGTAYNVFVIYTFTSGGQGIQHVAPITPKTP